MENRREELRWNMDDGVMLCDFVVKFHGLGRCAFVYFLQLFGEPAPEYLHSK